MGTPRIFIYLPPIRPTSTKRISLVFSQQKLSTTDDKLSHIRSKIYSLYHSESIIFYCFYLWLANEKVRDQKVVD